MLVIIAVTILKILSKNILQLDNLCDIQTLFKESLKKLSIRDLC